MNQVIIDIILCAATGYIGWLFKSLKTKRELKQEDLNMVSASTQSLVDSITKLTEQNEVIVSKLQEEQLKNIQYLEKIKKLENDKVTLQQKVDALEVKIDALTKQQKDFLDEIEHLKTSTKKKTK